MAIRRQHVDLELKGISQIINEKSSPKALMYVKDMENMSIEKEGTFHTNPVKQSRSLLNPAQEKILDVINLKIKDNLERTGILTERSLYIANLEASPLLTSPIQVKPLSIENLFIRDFPEGLVSVAASSLNLTQGTIGLVVQTYSDKALYFIGVEFEMSGEEIVSIKNISALRYITTTPDFTNIIYHSGYFCFFSGRQFSIYNPLTSSLTVVGRAPSDVKSFIFYEKNNNDLKFYVRSDDDETFELTFNIQTKQTNFVMLAEDHVASQAPFPFEFSKALNGYEMLSHNDTEEDLLTMISFSEGSGYFVFQEDTRFMKENVEDIVQAKVFQDRALPAKPPVPPRMSGNDQSMQELESSGIPYQIYPMILPSRLINDDGSIPQPGELHFLKIYKSPNKIKSLILGNQNLITGSLLRQYDKAKIVEFGFNALPRLKDIGRTELPSIPENYSSNQTDIIAIDNASGYRNIREVSYITDKSNIETNFVELEENRQNIYPLPPLELIARSALVNRVYKAVYSWIDEKGAIHRSEASLSKTYKGSIQNQRYIELDQTFKVYYRRNDDNSYSLDTTRTKELLSQRWKFYHKDAEEFAELSEKLLFTKKDNVNIEVYSTDPRSQSSINFYLGKVIPNDNLSKFVIPRVEHIVSDEDALLSKELSQYDLEKFVPPQIVNLGRLLIDDELSEQPEGSFAFAEHDAKFYLSQAGQILVSESLGEDNKKPSLIFKGKRIPFIDEILATESQDNNLIIFSPEKAYLYNENFETPRSVRGPKLKIQGNNRHFHAMSDGIIFKDTNKGFFLFSRSNDFIYIGRDIDDLKTEDCLDIFHHPRNKEIMIITTGGPLIYNWLFGVWTKDYDFNPISGAATNNKLFYAEGGGNILEENLDRYHRTSVIETHFIGFKREIREKRFIGLRIEGDFTGLTSIRAQYAFNGSDDFHDITVQELEESSAVLGIRSINQLDLLTSEQRCETMKFRIRFNSDTNKKIRIEVLSLIVGLDTNKFNIAESLRIGG